MDKETVFKEVASAAGGVAKLARALDESTQTVMNWRVRGFPANRCRAIEQISGIPVRRLRPDDWSDYWPEPAEARATALLRDGS